MAMKPAAAPMPGDEDEAAAGAADTSTAPGDETGTEPEGDEGEDSTVLVTICRSADGTYLVYSGDEPGEDEEGTEGAGTGEGEPAEGEGAEAAGAGAEGEEGTGGAMGEEGEEAEPPKVCDSIGAALKATLDLLKEDSESEGGKTGDEQFSEGFVGGSEASPAKPKASLAQKY